MKSHSGLLLLLSTLHQLTQFSSSSHFSCGDVNPITAVAPADEDNSFTVEITNPAMHNDVDLVDDFHYEVTIRSEMHTSSALGLDVSTKELGDNSTFSEESTSPLERGTCPLSEDVYELPLSFNWTSPNTSATCVSLRVKLVLNSTYWTLLSTTLCRPAGCRKYFTGGSGVITSKNHPSPYPDGQNCTYIILVEHGETIHLQFQEFDVEDPYINECLDYIKILYDNASTQPLCGRLTGDDLKFMYFVSSANLMKINFVSDNKINSGGFRAVYQSSHVRACNSTWKSLEGEITSPGYPNAYYPNLMCVITIDLPASFRIILKAVELDFGTVESPTACKGDLLTIRDISVNHSLVTWCSAQQNSLLFESSGSSLEIVFMSDHTFQGRGFRLDYHGVASCTNRTYHTNNGFIDSVNFPQHYPNSQHCFYIISTSQNIIELTFQHFYTESTSDQGLRGEMCDKDYVEIYVGLENHRVCGNWTGREHLLLFRSFGNKIVFKFVSNDRETRKGFYGSWRVIEKSQDTRCLSQILDTQNDRFEIVFTPQTWGDGEFDCRSRGGHLAKVADIATHILISEHLLESNCSRTIDTFWIGANDQQFESDFYWTDGSKVSFSNWFSGWPAYGNGNSQPSDDGFSGEDCVEMSRRFHYPYKGSATTDTFYWNDRNCMVKNPYICQCYKDGKEPTVEKPAECNQTIKLQKTSDTFVLESPNYPSTYFNFLDCFVFVQAPENEKIVLDFSVFNLEGDESCEYDFLSLSSYPWNSAVDAKRICGNWTGKTKLLRRTLLTSFAFLQFHSDHSFVFPGFSVTISLEHASLNNTSGRVNSTLSDGRLELPAKHYDAEMKCDHRGARLCQMESQEEVVSLTSLLPRHPDVQKLWVANLMRDAPNSGNLCQAIQIDSTEKHQGITFTSSYHTTTVSCAIQLDFVCCRTKPDDHVGRIEMFNSSTGSILNPILPNTNYTNYENITYVISAETGNRILITMDTIDLEYQDECLYDYLLLTNTTSDGRHCNATQQHFLSIQNEITVTFLTDYSVTSFGFALSWRWVDLSECQATVEAKTTGTISSFNYPFSFPDSVKCFTILKATKGNRLFVEFVYLKLLNDVACSSFIEVWTGEKEHHTLCNDTETFLCDMQFLSLENEIKIVFETPELQAKDGFILSYEELAVPTIMPTKTVHVHPETNIEVKSFNAPYGFPPNLVQTTTFRAPIGYVIGVNFTELQLAPSVSCGNATLVMVFEDTSLGTCKALNTLCNPEDHGNDVMPVVWSYLHRLTLTTKSGESYDSPYTEFYSAIIFAVKDPAFLNKTIYNDTFDACQDPEPCLNDGQCIQDNATRAHCKCVGYYTGLFCQVTMCDVGVCSHGNCSLEKESYTCTCDPGYWGDNCSLDFVECRETFCTNQGDCTGSNTTMPGCRCDVNWEGDDCSKPKTKILPAIGERLLREPIWVGLIVILTVLLAFGIFYVVKRKCFKHSKCCKVQMKMKEDTQVTRQVQSQSPEIVRAGVSGRNNHRHLSVTVPAGIHINKTDDPGCSTGTSTPSVVDKGGYAAARFFASYQEAERSAISPPVAVDFSKDTATFMSTGPRETSAVGTLLSGALSLAFRETPGKQETSFLSPDDRRSTTMRKAQSINEQMLRQSSFGDVPYQHHRSKSISEENPSHIFPKVIISGPDNYNQEVLPLSKSHLEIDVGCCGDGFSLSNELLNSNVVHLNDTNNGMSYVDSCSSPMLRKYLYSECERTQRLKQKSASFDMMNEHPRRRRYHHHHHNSQDSNTSDTNTLCECRKCQQQSERRWRISRAERCVKNYAPTSQDRKSKKSEEKNYMSTRRRRAQYQNSRKIHSAYSSYSTVEKESACNTHKPLSQMSSSESENSRKYYNQKRLLNKMRTNKMRRSGTSGKYTQNEKLCDSSKNDLFRRIFSEEVFIDSDDDPGLEVSENPNSGPQLCVPNTASEKTGSSRTRTCSVIMYEELYPILESQPISRKSQTTFQNSLDTEEHSSKTLLQMQHRNSVTHPADGDDSALGSSPTSTQTSPLDEAADSVPKLVVQKKYSSDNSVKDSAYQTKQSSVEVSALDSCIEAWSGRRRICSGTTNRYEDKRVDHRLRQTVLKLHKLQHRSQRRNISRDSAIYTPSADTSDITDGSSLDSNIGQTYFPGRNVTKVPVNSYDSAYKDSLASSQESVDTSRINSILEEYSDLKEVNV